ncbi:MAG: hypothetical protein H7Y88_10110 [Phycisphaerales bacterium]|nr:hypothetical protein [Phycisphaerales bacterium]
MKRQGGWRAAFWAYAAVLFTLTHWPNAKLPPMAIKRPDLLLHIALFGLWSFLLVRSGYLRARSRETPRRGRLLLVPLVVAVASAAIDEALQAIPALRRTAVVDDCLANMTGAGLGWLTGIATPRLPGAPLREPPGLRPDPRGAPDA